MADETTQRPTTISSHEVFISHSSKDKEKAFQLCDILENKGIKCWISPRDTKGVGSFADDIIEAIDASQALVLVYSSHANKSNNVFREVVHAAKDDIEIIPYVIEKAPLSKRMEYYIESLHQIDATPQSVERPLEKLISVINGIRNGNGQTENGYTEKKVSMPLKSSVNGRVITDINGTVGIGGAYVAIIKADGSKSVIYETTTDAYGNYQFLDIDISGKSGPYQVYAIKTPYGDAYSNQVNLGEESEIIVNVEIINKLLGFSLILTPHVNTLLTGGMKTIVTAQLCSDQVPLALSGISVTFSTKDQEIIALPKNDTYITDENGRAEIPLISYDNPGVVKIKANAIINRISISGETEIKVVLWGAITGVIYDQNNVGLPNANVTLWYYRKNVHGAIERISPVDLPENPQLANDGRTAQVGRYRYGMVPSGDYCLTGEKEGRMYYTLIHLDQGTVTQDVIIPGYSFFRPTR